MGERKRTRKATSLNKNGEKALAFSPLDSQHTVGDDDQAARLAFAFSAIAPNALISCTAMSASTLRSIVMPALFRPLIRRLYERPNWRAAALIRTIHSARNWRLRCLRPI